MCIEQWKIASVYSFINTRITYITLTGACYNRMESPVGLIIDTDAGSDDLMAIAYLLQYEQRWRESGRDTQQSRPPPYRLEAITVVRGLCTVTNGANNIRRLLNLAGRQKSGRRHGCVDSSDPMFVPVYDGETVPIDGNTKRGFPAEWTADTDNLTGVELPQLEPENTEENQLTEVLVAASDAAAVERTRSSPAVQFLRARLQDRNKPCKLLALGPLTNIATAIQHIEDSNIRVQSSRCSFSEVINCVVAMAGAFCVPGNVFKLDIQDFHTNQPELSEAASSTHLGPHDPNAPTVQEAHSVQPPHSSTAATKAEWNVYVDPHAAEYVFESFAANSIPTYLVCLDATNTVPMDRSFIEQFFAVENNGPLAKFVCEVIRCHSCYIEQGVMYAWVRMNTLLPTF
jgi:inosine-uridine nucleoside N-ribohydrolase